MKQVDCVIEDILRRSREFEITFLSLKQVLSQFLKRILELGQSDIIGVCKLVGEQKHKKFDWRKSTQIWDVPLDVIQQDL